MTYGTLLFIMSGEKFTHVPTDFICPHSIRWGKLCFILLLAIAGNLFLGCASFFHKKEPVTTGTRIPGQIILQWNGDPNVTFNLYRRSENGNDLKINNDPIKPMEAFSGGKQLTPFEYVDRTVMVGEEYYYTLETIDKDGKTSIWESAWKMTGAPLPNSSPPK